MVRFFCIMVYLIWHFFLTFYKQLAFSFKEESQVHVEISSKLGLVPVR